MAEYHNYKILIIDDSRLILRQMGHHLSELGVANVEAFSQSSEASARIFELQNSGETVDVVFCDVNMPEPDGLQILEQFRGVEHLKTVPFYLITAETKETMKNEAIGLGVTEILNKPATPEKFLEVFASIEQKKAS